MPSLSAEYRCIALIGHTQCGMVNLIARKAQFVQAAGRCGWLAGTVGRGTFFPLRPDVRDGTKLILF